MNCIEFKHLSEINRTNLLGMKGAMAEEFGTLITNLWNGKHNWINAYRLRVRFVSNLFILS